MFFVCKLGYLQVQLFPLSICSRTAYKQVLKSTFDVVTSTSWIFQGKAFSNSVDCIFITEIYFQM